MTIFKIKTGDEQTFKLFQTNTIITVDHLIQYNDRVKIGSPVLFSFGGDGTPWNNGLAGFCRIHSTPIDLGYEKAKTGDYYKLELEIVCRLKRHFEKSDFQRYPQTFDSGVGPSTKGERNQALGIIDDSNIISVCAICRGVLDEEPEHESELRNLFGNDIINKAKTDVIVYTVLCQSKPAKTNEFIQKHEQIIYYGVPGSGKSYSISEKLKNLGIEGYETQTVRVVFHPEYTNSDFIGQIFPSVGNDGCIKYEFKPGPFTKILKNAYLNPDKAYCLIIEEINRGNASAIFGEIFQLLDRLKVGEEQTLGGNKYTDGWSSYTVDNDDINAYIRDNEDEKVTGGMTFTANTGIRLPSNLSILATMNTSDQNVFTLDNAFQRRWDMQLVLNEFRDSDAENKQKDAVIGETDEKWGDFLQKVNAKISSQSANSGLSSMEDKRLGCWFVKNDNGKISREIFKNKVLKYLWDDAFKFSKSEIFASEYNSFEDLIREFDAKKFKIFKF